MQYQSIALHVYKNPLFSVDKNEAQVLIFIYWDCKILSGTATFHKRGVPDCNFQNPSEIPDFMIIERNDNRLSVEFILLVTASCQQHFLLLTAG